MIQSIYKLLNLSEKNYFKYIFALLCLNSVFELLSLAVFYPLIKFLVDDTYSMATINSYLVNYKYQITNTNELIFLYLALILIMFLIKNSFYIFYIYKQNKFLKKNKIKSL